MSEREQTTLGAQVQRYRKLAGLSGEALADAAGEGLTRSVIANLENGRKSDLTVRQLMAISAALHVPPVVLLADVFDPGAPSSYPLPAHEVFRLDFTRGGLLSEPSLDRNSELIAWVGGQSFRTSAPISNNATRAASRAYHAVQGYLRQQSQFAAAAAKYYRLPQDAMGAEEEYVETRSSFEEVVQQAAEGVLAAIATMRTEDVKVSEKAEESVYATLAALGLTYTPPPSWDES